jgi:hypothetical protein
MPYVNIAWRKRMNVRLNSGHCVSKSRMLFERNIKAWESPPAWQHAARKFF